ncbi:MAG TPA: hypothetical protein VFD70_18625 [Anaerolineae bacterium]|nr:hypothetical protein [Anaerolineae bacterium]
MSNPNLETIQQLAVKVTRPVDLGEYADDYAGKQLQVWVNCPGVVEESFKDHDDETFYPAARRSVAMLYELPLELVETLDDGFVFFLYIKGTDLYGEYHKSLKKKSAEPSNTAKSE